ncbi:MAG: MBL fold metallo-hydrolase [Methylococcales bacterium]|nr:MBL fold metallo-hydrolase [Methylococcales bacterium]
MNKMLIILIVGMFFSGCSNNKVNLNMPVRSGMMMEVKPSDTIRFDTNPDRLQIYWFGTASHYIQFGEIALLTDPFVTAELEKHRKAQSDQLEVKRTFGRLKQPPDAIFIGHSHGDHLLDAHTAMLKISTWNQVPLYGSQSTQYILMGHGNSDLNDRVKVVKSTPYGEWVPLPISKQKSDKGYSIEYMALKTAHTPHFSFAPLLVDNFSFSGTLLDGIIDKPLSKPPTSMDYQSGEVYNFLFRFRHDNTEFIVMMLGSPMPLIDYPQSLPPQGIPIDVVFGLTANADNVNDYPKEQMERLKPRVIILSHFNNFFHKNADEILHIEGHPLVDIEQYLLDVQKIADYPGFEKIIVPAITEFDGDLIRNVILIDSKK